LQGLDGEGDSLCDRRGYKGGQLRLLGYRIITPYTLFYLF